MNEDRFDNGNNQDHPPGNPEWGGDDPSWQPMHLDTETLSAYLDRELNPQDRQQAGGHLSSCQECSRELAELRATTRLLQGLPQYRPRRSFTLDARYARTDFGGRSRLARFLPYLPMLRTAAIAAAFLLIAVTAGDFATRSENNEAGLGDTNAPTDVVEFGQTGRPAAPEGAESTVAPTSAAPAADVGSDETAIEEEPVDDSALDDESADEGGAAPDATATATSPPTPVPTPVENASTTAEDERTGWRIAQAALAVVLALLVIALVVLQRLRSRILGP